MIERTNTASLTLTGGKELKESFCPLHKEHFKEHYAARVPQLEMPPKRGQPENFPHSENVKVTVNEDPPTLEEMEHALKTFKNNKSAGTDKRKTEGLKYNSSNQLICVLFLLFITKFVVSHCAFCKLRRNFGFFCSVSYLSGPPNTYLLARVQKVMVCDTWLVNFDPFFLFRVSRFVAL